MNLRPYQLDAIELVRDQYRAQKRRPILVVPTGGGKTLTAASILRSAVQKGRRVGFVAHRKELIDQTVETFARLGFPSVSVIKGKDRRFDPRNPIQIASVQTLVKRDPVPGIDVWVIDECHRALAASYLKSIFMAYPQSLFLGLTATPCGPNGKPMGAVFDSLVIGARYSELIAQGHIVAPIVFSTPTQADLSSCRTTGGDYNLEDLEAAVNRGALIGNLVEEWRRHGSDRRTVVFAVSVAHSRAIQARFSEASVACEHLDGETPEELREGILRRLASGETSVVCNVGVLTEGWDLPAVKCAILARPTKSLSLYMQMAGRTLRPYQGVTPIILDHGGNVDRHGMPHEDRDWSLTTKPKRTGAAPCKLCKVCFCYIAASLRTCPHCGAEAAPDEERVKAKDVEDVALAKRSEEQRIRETPLPDWAMALDGHAGKVFQSLLRRAIAMKYKRGWIRYRFEAVIKHPLPREWAEKIGA